MQILAEAEDLPKISNNLCGIMLLPIFMVVVVQGRHR